MRDLGKITFIVLGLVFLVLTAMYDDILYWLIEKDLYNYTPHNDGVTMSGLALWLSQSTFRILGGRAVPFLGAIGCFFMSAIFGRDGELES